MPEPLVPEPLLPEPEVWASTKGAVTTSTARAATTILLNLLNISLFSYSLQGCACWLLSLSRVPSLPSAWKRTYQAKSNSYATGLRRTARPQRCPHVASHSLLLRVAAGGAHTRAWSPSFYQNEHTQECSVEGTTTHSAYYLLFSLGFTRI